MDIFTVMNQHFAFAEQRGFELGFINNRSGRRINAVKLQTAAPRTGIKLYIGRHPADAAVGYGRCGRTRRLNNDVLAFIFDTVGNGVESTI